jgi:hypothetical protein
MEEEEYGDVNPQFHAKEKEMEQKIDELAKKANVIFQTRQGGTGDEPIFWAKILEVVLWIYMVLTILSSIIRPEFMSLTCIAIGFLSVGDPYRFGRRTFRIVTAGILTTFVYDLIWLFWLRNSDSEIFEDSGSSGLYWIRTFCMFVAYISFFFRIIVIAVFWKVSLNFISLMKGRGSAAS